MLIQNKDQYEQYLDEVNNLVSQDPDLNTSEGERLSLLALAIKEYEDKNFFFEKPTPVEAIRFRMKEQNLKQQDLVRYIGNKSKVSEILAGKRNLTVTMIRALNIHLKIPLDILIQETKYETHELNIEKIDWRKFPIKEMAKRGWIKLINNNEENKKKIILEFLKPLEKFSLRETLWRRTFHNRAQDSSNSCDLIAWIARAIKIAEKINIGDYKRETINYDYLKELAKLSRFVTGPVLAKEMLEKSGIKLVFLKHLPKTKVDGACFLDLQKKPIIALSLRYDRIDNFWYTLLHEMSHVLKHLNEENQFIDDLEVDSSYSLQEQEADKIAKDSFIPSKEWNKITELPIRNSFIQNLADKLNIHPAIIAGRIRYETKDYSKFNTLIGQGQISKVLKKYINI